MNTQKKIIFLTYIPSPYRVEFFNELAKFYNLFVIYYNSGMETAGWKSQIQKHNYKHTFLFETSRLKGIFNLIQLINKNKNEIIIIGGYGMLIEIFAIFYLKILKIEFVLNSDGGFITKGRLKTIFKKILIKSASYWLSSGMNTTRTLQYYGAKKSNIYEYHFTSLTNKDVLKSLLPDDNIIEIKKSFNLKANISYAVFVGQLISRKGIDILINAISIISDKNVEFLLIGDGEQGIELEELVKSCGLESRIHFLGKKTKEEVINYLRISDIFVLPSREDIWGLVVNEAASNGLALIASDMVGSAYNLIEDGKNGYIISNENIKELALKIDLICSSNLESMKQESLEIAKNYTIERMVKDHLELFKKLN